MAGDYTKFQRHYQSLTTDFTITALTASINPALTVRNSAYSLFLQLGEFNVTTFVASVVTVVGVTTGNVYMRFDIPATAPTNTTEFYRDDKGPTGLQVTAGENVKIVVSQVGVAGYLHIEAYQKYVTSGALNAQTGAQ